MHENIKIKYENQMKFIKEGGPRKEMSGWGGANDVTFALAQWLIPDSSQSAAHISEIIRSKVKKNRKGPIEAERMTSLARA